MFQKAAHTTSRSETYDDRFTTHHPIQVYTYYSDKFHWFLSSTQVLIFAIQV